MLRRKFFMGVNGIAMAGQGRNLKSPRRNRSQKIICFAVVRQQLINRTMSRARISPGADLHCLDSQATEIVERLIEWLRAQDNGKHAYFHKGASTLEEARLW